MSISLVFMAPIELACLIPALASFQHYYQGFAATRSLPSPHRIWNWLVTVVAWITLSVIHFLYETELNVAIIFYFLLNALQIVTFSLMGITIADFIRKIAAAESELLDGKSVENIVTQHLTEFESLKKGWSAFCFMLYTSSTVHLVANIFALIALKIGRVITASNVVFIILKVIYSSLLAEDCYQAFKSQSKKIRYVCIFFFFIYSRDNQKLCKIVYKDQSWLVGPLTSSVDDDRQFW